MSKKAIITGIGGQDACFMSDLLLKENYKIYGTVRPNTNYNFWRLCEQGILNDIEIIQNDISDCSGVFDLIANIKPDLFINLAAISAVGQSFLTPVTVAQIDAMGPLYCLEAIRQCSPTTRFYTAGSSEMVGNIKNNNGLTDELTSMLPESPYAISKLFAHNLVRVYRQSYNIYASSSILFNHSSRYRGSYFIERKIGKYVAELKLGLNKDYLYLGNIDASRDIGHSQDYVYGIYLSMMENIADDYVFATGNTYTIRQILKIAFEYIGEDWTNYIKIDKSLLRPSEVHCLIGNSSKAQNILGWKPQHTFEDIMEEIIEADIVRLKNKMTISKLEYEETLMGK